VSEQNRRVFGAGKNRIQKYHQKPLHCKTSRMSSDLDSSFDETMRCSTSACINNQDQNPIQCGDCKRYVHYRCTMLPATGTGIQQQKNYDIFLRKLCHCSKEPC